MILVITLGIVVNTRPQVERFIGEMATGVLRPNPSIKADDKGE